MNQVCEPTSDLVVDFSMEGDGASLYRMESDEQGDGIRKVAQRTPSRFRSLSVFWRRAIRLRAERIWTRLFRKHDYERVYLAVGGHIFFQTLYAAVQFDLFTLLSNDGPLTREQIARKLGLEEKPTRILLLGCAALGLVHKRGTAYQNSGAAEELLAGHSSRNIRSFVDLEYHVIYKAMFHFYDAIRQNRNVGLGDFEGNEPTLYQRLAHYPKLEQIFQDAMHDLTVQANADLARYVDFSRYRRIVDVGGGDGTNIIELATQWPHLNASVFDLPSVCTIAQKNIQKAGLSGRLSAIPGNCFENDFPPGADCFLFAHFFTIWTEEKDRFLLKKAFDALRPGGSVILFNMMQANDGTGPLTAAIGSPYFLTLATGEGMLYSWHEYETWMNEVGFSRVQRYSLPHDHGVIIGTKV